MRRERQKIQRQRHDEQRLSDLYAAAYQRVEPSEALRRHVAEGAARAAVGTAHATRVPWPPVAWGAAAVTAALLGWLFLRPEELIRERRESASSMAAATGRHVAEESRRVSGVREAADGPRRERPHPPAPSPNAGRGGADANVEGGKGGEGGLASSAQTPARTDDLAYLNAEADWPSNLPPHAGLEPLAAPVSQEARRGDDFVHVPLPRLVDNSNSQIAVALKQYERETAIVDPRLTRMVTLSQKGTALSDLCDHLRTETRIRLTAGASVADEKVTIFCSKRPLREVMRQLSRAFGYIWLRRGKVGDYRYELVQDMKSQILEEEMRSRDRNAALIAVHEEMKQYRAYLHLSPDEALAASKSASPAEKPLLERLGGRDWAPIQMYFRLTPDDLAALREGQTLNFSQDYELEERPQPNEQAPQNDPQDAKPRPSSLPAEVARGALQSHRELRIRANPAEPWSPQFGTAENLPGGVPAVSYPGAHAWVSLQLGHTELGQYTMESKSGIYAGETAMDPRDVGGELATGVSPSARNPENARQNARWSRDPALRARVPITPEASHRTPAADDAPSGSTSEKKVTSADVLEALHRASGLPIVADYYTRLYPASQVSVRDATLFDALNRLSDRMRLRWRWEKTNGNWLQFRSVSYYHDRLKEVPNRLLNRWSGVRRQRGHLPLDHLCEIAQLTEVQLKSEIVAEGVRELFDLPEWDLARRGFQEHLRFLAKLTPEQRRTTRSDAGLPFGQLTMGQQQQFVAHLGERIQSLEQASQMTIRVEYLQPGEFQWMQPGMSEFGPGRSWPANMFRRPTVRGRTREEVLEAARRIDPMMDPAQIRPTEYWLAIIYGGVQPESGRRFELGRSGNAQGMGGYCNWE
jgi:hypothetical protein